MLGHCLHAVEDWLLICVMVVDSHCTFPPTVSVLELLELCKASAMSTHPYMVNLLGVNGWRTSEKQAQLS